jgi:3-phenylpropionate/cinnamic acid dioxygenase small subunit
MTDREEIERLLIRYAELFDDGDFEACSHLFDHGTMTSTFDGRTRSATQFREQHESYTIKYEGGTPLTSHLITNIQIWVDSEALSASSRCYVTVLQATPALPLQPIYVGRYFDRFHKIDGSWYFAERKSVALLRGDQSHHQIPSTQAG